MFLYSSVSTLKPIVGIVFFGLPSLRRYRIDVLPLASRPTISMRISRLLNIRSTIHRENWFTTPFCCSVCPIFPSPSRAATASPAPTIFESTLIFFGAVLPAAAAGTAAPRSICPRSARSPSFFDFDAHLQ